MSFWSPTPDLKNIPVSIRSSEGQGTNTIFLNETPSPDLAAYIKEKDLSGMYDELWVYASELHTQPK